MKGNLIKGHALFKEKESDVNIDLTNFANKSNKILGIISEAAKIESSSRHE